MPRQRRTEDKRHNDLPETKGNQIEGDRLTDGTIAVVVNAHDKDLQLDVVVQAEGGILFQENAVVTVASGERQSAVENIVMRPQESRQLPFPYKIDPDTALSGEYVLEILALPKGENATPIVERTRTFIQVQDGKTVMLQLELEKRLL